MRDRRPELTVIAAGVDRVLRVDFDAAFTRLASISRTPPPGASLSDCVALAIEGDARPASKTWVIFESAWSQTIELPEPSVAALGAPELERALAYELEPESGIPAAFARIGARRLAGVSKGRVRFWVVVVHASELAAASTHLASRGSALQGVVHPAGLCGSGARVEVWDQATLCTDGALDGNWLVIGAHAGQRSWTERIGEWFANVRAENVRWTGRARATLLAPDLARLPIEDVGEGTFAKDGDAWVTEAARALVPRDRRVPMVLPPPRAPRTVSPRAVAIALGLAALVFVLVRYRSASTVAAGYEERSQAAQGLLGGQQMASKARTELSKKLAEAKKDVDARRARISAIESEWRAQCERPQAIVEAIQRAKPSTLTLLALRSLDQGGIAIEGAGLDAGLAQRFASDLEVTLAPAGMHVYPARTTNMRTDNDAIYVAFTIEVRPEGSALAGAAAAKSPRHVP